MHSKRGDILHDKARVHVAFERPVSDRQLIIPRDEKRRMISLASYDLTETARYSIFVFAWGVTGVCVATTAGLHKERLHPRLYFPVCGEPTRSNGLFIRMRLWIPSRIVLKRAPRVLSFSQRRVKAEARQHTARSTCTYICRLCWRLQALRISEV